MAKKKKKRNYGSTSEMHRTRAASWGRTFRAHVAQANKAIRHHSTASCSTAFMHLIAAAQSIGFYAAEQRSARTSKGDVLSQRMALPAAGRSGEISAGKKLQRVAYAYEQKCMLK